MSLNAKQMVFTRNVAKLIEWVYANGYELTFGEAYRTPEQARINTGRYNLVHADTGEVQRFPRRGIQESLHCLRLAVDINLFKDGVYLTDTSAHAPLGAYWKTLHPNNRWGGDFPKPDGNHYEMVADN